MSPRMGPPVEGDCRERRNGRRHRDGESAEWPVEAKRGNDGEGDVDDDQAPMNGPEDAHQEFAQLMLLRKDVLEQHAK